MIAVLTDELDRVRCFFFFKQKTAYDMRISDLSSDVCSSDLVVEIVSRVVQAPVLARRTAAQPHEGARALGEHDREILAAHALVRRKIGRAVCRERVCQDV